jgi:nitrate/nitrite-specific signal transduction histidine kinase
MAALGLQLDWMARTVPDEATAGQLRELRRGVTSMLGELRFTMRDLVCGVSATCSLDQALTQLARSVSTRTGSRIDVDATGDGSDRLPLAVEHQALQIARTLVSAAVESKATTVAIRWEVGPEAGTLAVAFEAEPPAPGGHFETDSPILRAAAEVADRSWAIGAKIGWETTEEGQWHLRCQIPR